jgi:hypothetical protein
MRSFRRFSIPLLSLLVAVPAAGLGCQPTNACGAGFAQGEDEQCRPVASPSADAGIPPTDGGNGVVEDAAADAPTAPSGSSFGKTCASMADCGGDAPICGAPQLPMCTQIMCQAGEANAGACPADFTCLSTPGNPSVCLKM